MLIYPQIIDHSTNIRVGLDTNLRIIVTQFVLKKKFFNWLSYLSISNYIFCFWLAPYVLAVNLDQKIDNGEKQINSSTRIDQIKASPSDASLGINNTESITENIDTENNLSAKKGNQKINLIIRITTPLNRRALDWCRIYPYPVAPPIKKMAISDLPYTDKALRSTLLSMSYWNKTQTSKPYPAGGWRMQIALQRAIKKSGLGLPHTIFTEYPWVDNMIPYVRKEIFAINAEEKERVKRYDLAQSVFKEYRSDLEVQAFNNGLFPIDVPMMREIGGFRRGHALVDKANWWIVAMHKVPGLKYYWLWPVKLNENPEQVVILNEDNAICVEGAW